MKLVTHHLFSIGLMLVVASFFRYPVLFAIFLVVVAMVLTNILIDEVGHTRDGGIPRRTWVTHSIVTAPLWGAAAGRSP